VINIQTNRLSLAPVGKSHFVLQHTNGPDPVDHEILTATLSPWARFLLAGCQDRKASLFERDERGWGTGSASPSPFILPHPDAVTAVAFHPLTDDPSAGHILATACSDLRIRLWTRVDENWETFAVLPGHTQMITKMEFAADGRTLVTRGQAGQRTYSCEECGPLDALLQLAVTR
jgi:WD40 repeat protein